MVEVEEVQHDILLIITVALFIFLALGIGIAPGPSLAPPIVPGA